MVPQTSFDAFYAASYARIVGQLFTALGNLHEAEDAAQEGFARAAFRWSYVRTYDSPEAWVRRVAFNLAINSLRRSRRVLRLLVRLGPPPEVAELDADLIDLAAALRRVPLRQREVLALHYVAELPVAEVARQLRLPMGTVKSRLARGRAALARELDLNGEWEDASHA